MPDALSQEEVDALLNLVQNIGDGDAPGGGGSEPLPPPTSAPSGQVATDTTSAPSMVATPDFGFEQFFAFCLCLAEALRVLTLLEDLGELGPSCAFFRDKRNCDFPAGRNP